MCSRPRCRRDLSRRADSRDGAVDASGAVHLTTTPLITPEDMDAVAKRTVTYRAPGA
jgi:hypothetical protein